jgi:aerobic carbon-monoxide dehydrogenase small subunit
MSRLLEYEIEVNGEPRAIRAPARVTLLSLLREDLGLTGTKVNCQQGECGACTVLVDGRAVDACLMLAASAAGRAVTTIEGVPDDDEIKRAFLAEGALQCGYCTPGMILAVKSHLANAPTRTPEGLAAGLSGNYCRCTGYEAIVSAVASLIDQGREQDG